MTTLEKVSVGVTCGLVVVLAVLAWFSTSHHWLLWLAVSVGGLGGLAHEIAQSGGKVLFFQKYQDGMYLGSLAGIVLGAVAGLLVVRGDLAAAASSVNTVQLTYEIFIAGLALKGVTEAAGGRAVP